MSNEEFELDENIQAVLASLGQQSQDAANRHGDMAAAIALISMGAQFASDAGLSIDKCKLLIDKTFDFASMFTSKGGEG